MSTSTDTLTSLVQSEYKYGFYTESRRSPRRRGQIGPMVLAPQLPDIKALIAAKPCRRASNRNLAQSRPTSMLQLRKPSLPAPSETLIAVTMMANKRSPHRMIPGNARLLVLEANLIYVAKQRAI